MKPPSLSPEAREILRLLDAGGGLRVAGVTGTRFVIWRDKAIVGPVVSRAVVDEIEQAGLLTEKRHELSRSARVRTILKSLEAA